MSHLLDDLPNNGGFLTNLSNHQRHIILRAPKCTIFAMKKVEDLKIQVVRNSCNLTLRNFTKKSQTKVVVASAGVTDVIAGPSLLPIQLENRKYDSNTPTKSSVLGSNKAVTNRSAQMITSQKRSLNASSALRERSIGSTVGSAMPTFRTKCYGSTDASHKRPKM